MQVLCQLDAQGEDFLSRVPGYLADSGETDLTIVYARKLIESAWKNREATGVKLEQHTSGWSTDRLTPVDRNVIRTALAEFDLGGVPPKVIINEAIEIGNEYGAKDSRRFINGILDAIWKTQRGEG